MPLTRIRATKIVKALRMAIDNQKAIGAIDNGWSATTILLSAIAEQVPMSQQDLWAIFRSGDGTRMIWTVLPMGWDIAWCKRSVLQVERHVVVIQ